VAAKLENLPGKQVSDDGIVFGAPAERRQNHNDWTVSLGNNFNVNIVAVHNEMLLCSWLHPVLNGKRRYGLRAYWRGESGKAK